MVSRETSVAEGLTGLGLPAGSADVQKLVRLWKILVDEAIPLGFMGKAEADRVLTRHILESAALIRWLPPEGAVVDVGSGAGLPGLVIACLRPGPVIFVEAQGRRVAFIRDVASRLSIEVEVFRGRAEDAAQGPLRGSAAASMARALAPVPIALELTVPFVRVGGATLLLVGAEDAAAVDALGPVAETLGAGPPQTVRFEVPGAAEPRWVMIVHKDRYTPDRFPRTAQAFRRRPLGGDVT